jgi:Family of unknown function (DUF6573)
MLGSEDQIMEHGNIFEGAPVVFAYTRAQALADGVLVDVTATAKEAGFKLHTVVTEAVWRGVIEPPVVPRSYGESEAGRLWDVLTMCGHAMRAAWRRNEQADRADFEVMATDESGRHTMRHLWVLCGPGDDAAPVLTIMMQGED